MSRPGGNRGPSFFHGTNADLQVGDHVLPAAVTGVVQPHPSEHNKGTVAHATSREHTAWEFAHRAAHYVERGSGRNFSGPPPAGDARARVYRVEPVGDRSLGVENRRHPDYIGVDNQEHVAPAWRVTEKLDIQPPSDVVHVDLPGKTRAGYQRRAKVPNVWGNQGTLPIDWSAHASGAASWWNHPSFYHQQQTHRPEAQLAPTPHEEIPGQLEAFAKPKNSGYRARQRVLKGQG